LGLVPKRRTSAKKRSKNFGRTNSLGFARRLILRSQAHPGPASALTAQRKIEQSKSKWLHYNAISFSTLFICLGTRIQNLLNLYSVHHVTCPPSCVPWDSPTLCILSRYIRIVQIYFSTLSIYASVTQVLYICATLFIVAHYHVVFLDMSIQ